MKTRATSGVFHKLLTLLEHLTSPRVFKQSSCCSIFSFLCSILSNIICHFALSIFSLSHIVCPTSNFVFWILLCYLQTFLNLDLDLIIAWSWNCHVH